MDNEGGPLRNKTTCSIKFIKMHVVVHKTLVNYDTTDPGNVNIVQARPVPTLRFDPEVINPSYRPVAGVKELDS